MRNAKLNVFEPGIHNEAVITVINEKLEIEWTAGKQKVAVQWKAMKAERMKSDEDQE